MNMLTLLALTGRILAAVAPFLLLCAACRGANLPPRRRPWQLFMPLAAVVYAAAAMVTVEQISAALSRLVLLLQLLVRRIPAVGPWLSQMLGGLTSSWPLLVFTNCMILAGWCLVKTGLRGTAAAVCRKGFGLWAPVVMHFYEQNEGDDRPYLREDCQQLRRLLEVFRRVFIALACADLALCVVWSGQGMEAWPRWPVFGVLLMGELAFYLGGYTRLESLSGTAGGEEKAERPDFDRLHRDLEEAFGDRLLLGDKQEASPRPDPVRDREELEEMSLAEDGPVRITGNYFLHRLRAGEPVEMDFVRAALTLLQGRSVLFCNPFYRDLTAYLMLPVQHALLNHRRVLVVSGRCAGDEDVRVWLQDGLQEATGLDNLWRVDFLPDKPAPREEELPDVGVLRFGDLYDLERQQNNQAFLAGVELVLLLEPSNLMGTGQVGLRSICQQCERPGKSLTYCIFDRNCDGMVDALSHTVRQSLVEVSASPVPRAPWHQMFWAAEGPGLADRILPHISRYLGFGSELGVFALKEKVQQAFWYGGSRAAVQDLRWAVQQYTRGLCGYIGIPAEQGELDRRLVFETGLWQAPRLRDAFVLVEDEFCNLFEMARAFAARAEGEGFVNVLCGEYMLRDYMCANAALMENDPRAVPTLCPDFARTERNFLLRALLLMAAAPREETELRRELTLYGCRGRDVYRTLCELLAAHTDLPPQIIRVFHRDEADPATGAIISRKYFEVGKSDFGRLYTGVLRPAYFVVENEKSGLYRIGARMMGQVCQTLLPGQFFTYHGRHYQVQCITAGDGVIVRRAADHMAGRPCYRQLRRYDLAALRPDPDFQDLRGLRLRRVRADVRVRTDGYYAAPSRGDLVNAHRVSLEGQVEDRAYRNKELVQVELPGASGPVVLTLCALLNELFVTLYPNEAGFLSAVPCGAAPADDIQRAVVPALTGGPAGPALLLLEDCYMDLGLAVSAERSFQRILEMAADYLDWYLDPARERRKSAAPAEAKPEPEPKPAAEPAENAAPALADAVPGQVVEGEDEELLRPGVPLSTPLKEYLTFGGETDAPWLALGDTLAWLREHGFDTSPLHRARCGDPDMEEYLRHLEEGQHICDFCGAAMEPGSFEILKDGRERCAECSKTAVRRLRDVRALYEESHGLLEKTFGITLRSPIRIRVTNAKVIAREMGEEFKAGKGMDMRALGFARNRNGKYDIYLETGAPRDALRSTIVHELTHIWQYENWDNQEIVSRYGEDMRSTVYEGMAVWTEAQLMRCTGQEGRAKRYEYGRLQCDDAYGNGLRLYMKKYPFRKGVSVPPARSPFGHIPPL